MENGKEKERIMKNSYGEISTKVLRETEIK